jgi:hypothetical protein
LNFFLTCQLSANIFLHCRLPTLPYITQHPTFAQGQNLPRPFRNHSKPITSNSIKNAGEGILMEK